MTDTYDRDDLARRLTRALGEQFRGNKRSAYTAAGVSPQTFERALGGLPIREDRRLAIEDMLSGQSYVSAPGQTSDDTITEAEVMASIRQTRELMDAFEEQQRRRRP